MNVFRFRLPDGDKAFAIPDMDLQRVAERSAPQQRHRRSRQQAHVQQALPNRTARGQVLDAAARSRKGEVQAE